ncbi:hypothetical protein [Pyramidobacter piscolens]|nr:hypothetical protein [Pyramidobacter piscolens]BDF78355.1 hypothetical protein CE91St28_11490 [Pyramidobacter piscolens]
MSIPVPLQQDVSDSSSREQQQILELDRRLRVLASKVDALEARLKTLEEK